MSVTKWKIPCFNPDKMDIPHTVLFFHWALPNIYNSDPPGGSPNVKVVGVPVGNFREKPSYFFFNHILTPKRYQNLNP